MRPYKNIREIAFTWAFTFLSIFSHSVSANPDGDFFSVRRNEMVERQIKDRGIRDARLLEVIKSVPRHLFVPSEFQDAAYQDKPLPIGHSQTISQPYIVAYMTEALEVKTTDKVLEIGTGSGYQAAILSKLAQSVYTIELLEPLSRRAQQVITQLKIANVFFKVGDGWKGWPEAAPFDKIIVTAAASKVPTHLYDQLKDGGSIIFPFGGHDDVQALVLGNKVGGRTHTQELLPVRFVPLRGTHEISNEGRDNEKG